MMRWSLEQGMVVRRVGSGTRVVWIHGLGESSVSFESSVSRLPGYTHVLVDLPGCGRSPWPDTAASIEETADAIAAWLSTEPPAVLIGHSLGGVLATLVAERTPVRGLIDIDGNLTRGDCTFSAAAAAYSLDEFVAHGFDEMRAKIYTDGASRADLRGYHAALMFASPHVFHRHAHELVELSTTSSLAARLAAVGDKALFLTGATDGVCPDSRALLEAHAVRWIGIEGAGHWVYVDRPDAFTAQVARFLQAA
jgi:pimeloyl-ACP methyl ester carboxylesterase